MAFESANQSLCQWIRCNSIRSRMAFQLRRRGNNQTFAKEIVRLFLA
jgi:hypothetical protein